MNETIKNYKEAEEKIKIFLQTKNFDKSKKAIVQKQNLKTALQEMRELLENLKTKHTHEQILEEVDKKLNKINEVLGE